MALLTKDQIFAAVDIKTETVEVPEWGGSVMVRGMTGVQRDTWEKQLTPKRKGGDLNYIGYRARLAAATIIDEHGKLLFDDTDVQKLGIKSAEALDRVCEVAGRLSGINPQDKEELEKNFETPPSDSSG